MRAAHEDITCCDWYSKHVHDNFWTSSLSSPLKEKQDLRKYKSSGINCYHDFPFSSLRLSFMKWTVCLLQSSVCLLYFSFLLLLNSSHASFPFKEDTVDEETTREEGEIVLKGICFFSSFFTRRLFLCRPHIAFIVSWVKTSLDCFLCRYNVRVNVFISASLSSLFSSASSLFWWSWLEK